MRCRDTPISARFDTPSRIRCREASPDSQLSFGRLWQRSSGSPDEPENSALSNRPRTALKVRRSRNQAKTPAGDFEEYAGCERFGQGQARWGANAAVDMKALRPGLPVVFECLNPRSCRTSHPSISHQTLKPRLAKCGLTNSTTSGGLLGRRV